MIILKELQSLSGNKKECFKNKNNFQRIADLLAYSGIWFTIRQYNENTTMNVKVTNEFDVLNE